MGSHSRWLGQTRSAGHCCWSHRASSSTTARAVVVNTGAKTYFGGISEKLGRQRVLTSFDKGINSFTWLMIRFIAVMVPLVFVINGLTKHDWKEAFFFAVAVAVGLTPEMLPMIVTVNLAQGRHGDVAQEGHRQAPQCDSELRSDGRLVHG